MDTDSSLVTLKHEVIELHVVLQAWFRGEGSNDPSIVTKFFDIDFQMVGAAGRIISRNAFAAALPGFFGARPGLVMEIHDVEVRCAFPGGMLGFYREVQIQNNEKTERWSSVVLTMARGEILWKHLQETFCG